LLAQYPSKLRFENETKEKNAQASLAFFLFVHLFVGRAGFEPAKFTQQIYSLPSLAA
jgi:hypothetical protein